MKCMTTVSTNDAFGPLRRYDVSTVLLHFPIISIDCPIGAQIGLVITNHVLEFYYSFD